MLLGHFALPFCALVVRAIKRSTFAMTVIAVLLLCMHYLDVYWIAMPDAPFHGGWGYVVDAGALLFITGVASATWAVRRRGEAEVPVSDPRLPASLQYSTD
jgi:peptidoglycan/LPS O-acetylase OafA/YrhL